MPNFDQTGPKGAGRLTGKGDGPCNSNEKTGLGRRRGCCRKGQGRSGRGMRKGFGKGNCFQNLSLEEREKVLEQELKKVRDEQEKSEK